MLFRKIGHRKSEVILDLVERGHRLVADDVVILTKKGEGISTGAEQQLLTFYGTRGIGMADVRI